MTTIDLIDGDKSNMENIFKVTVSEYLTTLIEASDKTQKQIAEELGYENANIITMFKQGLTRVPLNKVGPIAKALDIDATDFLELVMSEYMPETLMALEPILKGITLTRDEYELVNQYRIIKDLENQRDLINVKKKSG